MSDTVHTGSILRISDEKTMQLLDLYRQEECLWNTNDEYYKDQLHRRRAAEKVAALLDIPNFGPRHVLMKFKNLRNAYSQELKKIARNKLEGVNYRPSVFWYKKMDAFIRPHLQKPRGAGKVSRSSLVFHVDGNEDWLQVNPQTPSYVLNTEVEDPTSENDSCDSQRKRKLPNRPNPNWPKIHKRDSDSDEPRFIEITIPQPPEETNTNEEIPKNDKSVKDYTENQHNIVLSSFKDLAASLKTLSSRDDDVFDSFGKYVAGLLRTLPHKKALEIQPQIVNLITAAGLENIDNKEKEEKGEKEQDCQICESVVVKIEKC